jgi:C4-dicarboxylate-specific signal transduction histidine kinase
VFSQQDVKLHEILKSCLELIAAKADDKGVRLLSDFRAQPDLIHTDANALKQVILNLGFNALQALEGRPVETWIRIETKNVANGIEVLVADNGPGLMPEVWQRLFQPFHSTKSSGFGLGLAICKDILSSLQASITADPPETDCGATFRIHLPSPMGLR